MAYGDSLPQVHDQNHILNPHLVMHENVNTHALMDNVAEQFIRSNGMSAFFLPKSFGGLDHIVGEEMNVKYDKMWNFAFYLEDYTGFSGIGSAYEYGGLTSHDKMKIMINPALFQRQCHGRMPEVGDWVYVPIDRSLFSVRYVDPYNKFYQFGYQAHYFIILNKVTYNQEEVNPEIQNDEFVFDDMENVDLSPLFNLDGRLDTHIEEFIVNDSVNEYADKIIVDDSTHQGSGSTISQNRVKVNSPEDIQKLLSGKGFL